ncbi:altronate dehydratase [candidate division KSB3 bacterium]|uniref:Altronate dehydratase n=1 Tax=candidate division KSB3 bacterium TaxID=2044937 RepID=A0A9D5JXP6_9BACT|nr:altronate dehydratase [candidate division KSB3 bacterium]MBD3326035.1 altronate dehydratase [candidate division KSB3 bacterium]
MIRIHPEDNVAVAIADVPAGAHVRIDERELILREPIARGHKAALKLIRAGEVVKKYGFPIGHATADIEPGAWVHTHNLFTNLEGVVEYAYTPLAELPQRIEDGLTFEGFVRENGTVGIRNEIWIVPTVGCVNSTTEILARQIQPELEGTSLEGVYAFPHPYGCSQLGADEFRTQQTLAGLVKHPNAGGVLVVGLGCEHNHIEAFQKVLGDFDPQRVRCITCQDCEDELEAGRHALRELIAYASRFRRQSVPIAALKVGMKCGASDGLSGITANPVVGAFSDLLAARGGTTVLTEVPEMFGAETLLMNRCADQAVFAKCVSMINGFKDYYLRHDLPIYENPAPGNKAGGITTLEEKSLGCIQKGGTSPVMDVLQYGDILQTPGLNLLDGPGADAVSITGLTAAGVHLILFTTGRGNPLGAPVPTVKISSNSHLAARKAHWIDFDAGQLLHDTSLPDLSQKLLHDVLDIASGKRRTCNEINQYREIAIFKDGVML